MLRQLQPLRGEGLGDQFPAARGHPDKAEFARALGADEVIRYPDPDAEGDRRFGTDPVDVVLDGVGGDLLGPAVRALAPGGRLVAFSSGGGTIEAYELLARGAPAIGFQVAAVARDEPGTYARWRDDLWERHRRGTLRAVVHGEVFPLAGAARPRAHGVPPQPRQDRPRPVRPGPRAAVQYSRRGPGRRAPVPEGDAHADRFPPRRQPAHLHPAPGR